MPSRRSQLLPTTQSHILVVKDSIALEVGCLLVAHPSVDARDCPSPPIGENRQRVYFVHRTMGVELCGAGEYAIARAIFGWQQLSCGCPLAISIHVICWAAGWSTFTILLRTGLYL